jgi:hypothetical protein
LGWQRWGDGTCQRAEGSRWRGSSADLNAGFSNLETHLAAEEHTGLGAPLGIRGRGRRNDLGSRTGGRQHELHSCTFDIQASAISHLDNNGRRKQLAHCAALSISVHYTYVGGEAAAWKDQVGSAAPGK